MAKTKPRAFVIQPFDKSFEGIYDLIRSAAAIAGVDVLRADSMAASGRTIAEDIQGAIQSASLVIADITNDNPNVMYEVGFAQAQGKPVLLVAASSRAIPFDMAGFRVSIYDISSPSEFVQRLARSILLAIERPEEFLASKAAALREKNPSVFISYAHSDREFLDRLIVHLKPLEKEGLIDLWVDTRLRAGDRWKKEIEKALQRATVAILIISADFLASDFITDNELPPLLKGAEERGTRIVPLIVKPCRFSRDKSLRHFQAVNDPRNALVLLAHGEQEMLYDQVASEVEKWLQRG